MRHGKSSAGGPPKRRSVASLHDWAVEAVQDYIENVRPMAVRAKPNALWLTERGTRLGTKEIPDRFAYYRDELGLDPDLTPHCLRHSYVTHLIEEGVDPVFVQQQVGHAFQSTTAVYTAVSTDFKNRMLQDAIRKVMAPSAGGEQ